MAVQWLVIVLALSLPAVRFVAGMIREVRK